MASQVVRIFATTQEPDHDNPWQASAPESGTGSGVFIGDGRVLTGAHVVAQATFLQVQKISDPNKFTAEVVAICHDADLALLHVADPRFAADIEPAEIGDLPDFRDEVAVVGFPVGGEEMSITEGVVSRIEVQRYSHSQRFLLAVTVDAAINPGNSGGPVFMGDQVAGIAFQKLQDAENIGELVPAPLIHRFLDAVDRGLPPDVPGLGITTQILENPLLAAEVGLGEDDSGVLVTAVEYGNSCYGVIQAGDALLEIDGHRIARNGTIRFRDRYRTQFDALLGLHNIGDRIQAVVLRDGARVELEIELQVLTYLVPRAQYDRPPSYFVYGGLVLQALSRDYLRIWGEDWWDEAPKEFLNFYYSGTRKKERREVVILTKVLADEINVGYGELYLESVTTVDGVAVRDLAHFVELVEQATGVVDIRTSRHGVLKFDAEQARQASARILARYQIPRDRSRDLPGASA